MKVEQVDVLVIGAGPAGAIASSLIHQEGLKVKVVEKQKFPRFVIGESLLPRVMDHLEEAKLLDAVKKVGFQEKFGAKFIRGNDVCDFDFSENFTEGWTWTWQVPRATFDNTILEELVKMGVDIEQETGVTDIKFNGTQSITTVEDIAGNKKQIEAKFIVDASGYGRVIPRMFDLDKPAPSPPRKTFFTHFKDTKRPEGIDGNRITVVVHEQKTWIWIIPFSNGLTSVGFVSSPEFFDQFSEDPTTKMNELIAVNEQTNSRFENAEMVFEPKIIQGYSISTKQLYGDGYILCGNATEFLDPVFSSGVTFAMESGSKAGKLVSKFVKGEDVDWETEYTQYMMQGIDTFRSYVNAWYEGDLHDIFFTGNPNQEIKKQICSVLAGYVWDKSNPFVKKHKTMLKTLAKVIRIEQSKKKEDELLLKKNSEK